MPGDSSPPSRLRSIVTIVIVAAALLFLFWQIGSGQ